MRKAGIERVLTFSNLEFSVALMTALYQGGKLLEKQVCLLILYIYGLRGKFQ
jgi:hypothetical protein